MSEPNTKSWISEIAMAFGGVIVGASLIGWFTIPDAPAPVPIPQPVVVEPVKPAPKPLAAPEAWIVLDSTGTRVTDASVEKIAGSLKAGKWTAQGIPRPGERGSTLTITVDDGVVPVVIVPPKPDVPVVPVPSLQGFAKVAYDASRSLPAADRSTVSDNFEGTAARIAAGEVRTVADANASLKAENARDVDRTTWLPFFVAWAAAADAQNKAGTLRTVEQYAQAFRDTTEGLRK